MGSKRRFFISLISIVFLGVQSGESANAFTAGTLCEIQVDQAKWNLIARSFEFDQFIESVRKAEQRCYDLFDKNWFLDVKGVYRFDRLRNKLKMAQRKEHDLKKSCNGISSSGIPCNRNVLAKARLNSLRIQEALKVLDEKLYKQLIQRERKESRVCEAAWQKSLDDSGLEEKLGIAEYDYENIAGICIYADESIAPCSFKLRLAEDLLNDATRNLETKQLDIKVEQEACEEANHTLDDYIKDASARLQIVNDKLKIAQEKEKKLRRSGGNLYAKANREKFRLKLEAKTLDRLFSAETDIHKGESDHRCLLVEEEIADFQGWQPILVNKLEKAQADLENVRHACNVS